MKKAKIEHHKKQRTKKPKRERNIVGQFERGVSGNPAGRPKKSHRDRVRPKLSRAAEKRIFQSLTRKAQRGSMDAIKLALYYAWGPPTQPPPPEPPSPDVNKHDLSALSLEELQSLERSLRKAAGEAVREPTAAQRLAAARKVIAELAPEETEIEEDNSEVESAALEDFEDIEEDDLITAPTVESPNPGAFDPADPSLKSNQIIQQKLQERAAWAKLYGPEDDTLPILRKEYRN